MFSEGDYEGVLEHINSSATNLNSDEKNYLAGISAFRLHQYDVAINFLKRVKNFKNHPDVNYLIAQAYYSKEERKLSANFFKKSVKQNYKPDASLYYLGTIHKELGLYNDAKNYFAQIHDTAFPDLSFIQAAHHQTGLLYLDGYIKTKKLSKKVIREKVLPKMVRAIKSAPNLPLTNIIKGDIKFIKNKYLDGVNDSPLLITFDQYFEYNTNVIYQSIEPTENNNSDSGLFNSALGLRYHFPTISKYKLQDTVNLFVNHQYHLEQKDPNIARFDGLTIGFQNKFLIEKPFKNIFLPLWISTGFDQQNMNNTLDGTLKFDTRTVSVMLGGQFKLLGLAPATELSYQKLTNFTGLNDQNIYAVNSIIPYSFNQYLIFFLQGEMKYSEYLNTPEFSNMQLSGTLTHKMKINNKNILTTSGMMSIIDTKKMRDTRGYEVTIAPQIRYEFLFKKYFQLEFKYRYERKLSKDKETFAYQQHMAGISFGVQYE